MLEGDDPRGRAVAVIFRPHPGAFRELMLCVPTPGNLPTFCKKNGNARGLAGGGMGTAELTDA